MSKTASRHATCDYTAFVPLRNLRGLIGTTLGLAVLFAVLISINDQLRESLARFVSDLTHTGSSPVVTAIGDATDGVLGMARDFSAGNPFMVAFLVVAMVLAVLMLRA